MISTSSSFSGRSIFFSSVCSNWNERLMYCDDVYRSLKFAKEGWMGPVELGWVTICSNLLVVWLGKFVLLYIRKTNLLMAASIILLIFCMNKKNVKNKLVEYVYCFVCFIFMLSFPSKFLSMFLYLIFRKINIFAFFSFLVE